MPIVADEELQLEYAAGLNVVLALIKIAANIASNFELARDNYSRNTLIQK